MNKLITILLFVNLLCAKAFAQSFSINTTGASADASAMLDVSSTNKGMLVPRMTTAQRTAIASPATGLVVYDNTLNQFYYYNGTAWAAMATGPNANNYWTLSGGNLYNNVGTLVGVGITSPAANLDVAGNFSGSNALLLRSGNTGTGTVSNQILFGFNNTANYRHAIKTRHNSAGAVGNALDFYLWQTTDGLGSIGTKHIMTLEGTGNVGIGYTNPSTALDVNGKTRTTTFQITTGATNGYVLQSDATGNASWVNANTLATTNYWTLSGGNLYNNSGTNVGIGTTTPSSKLDVRNAGFLQAAFTSTVGAANIVTAGVSGAEAANYYSTYSSGTIYKRWAYGKNDDGETGSNAGSDFFINRYDDNGNYLDRVMNVKRSNGNVAIGGNFNPLKRLHVSGGTRTDSLQITIGAFNGYVLQSDAAGNASWVNANTLAINETDPKIAATSANYIPKWSGTNLIDGMVYDNGSSVGIGTATPTSTLGVNGSLSVAVTVTAASLTLSGSHYCMIYTGGTGNTFTLPAANTCTGRIYSIINHGTDVLATSVYRTGNAATATTVAQDAGIKIISDGAEWRLMQ
jgi:hypothetical protein